MNETMIRQSGEEVTVELSVKEAMALAAGVRFHYDPLIAAEARRKVKAAIESLLVTEASKLHYQLLEA